MDPMEEVGVTASWSIATALGRLEAIGLETGKKVDSLVTTVGLHTEWLNRQEGEIKHLRESLSAITVGFDAIAEDLRKIQTQESVEAATKAAHMKWLEALGPLLKYVIAGSVGAGAVEVTKWWGG